MKLRNKLMLGACAILGAGSAEIALAQTAPQQDAGRDGVGLQEIIVTARRREESLQEIPVSVAAVTGAEMVTQGVRQLNQLTQAVPGLIITQAGGAQPTIALRGEVNRLGANPPGIGVFIDGIYQNRFTQLGRGPVDLARVEVAKGPQSALYGKNTLGGAIGFVTNDPTSTPEGSIEFGYGGSSVPHENLWHAQFVASFPIVGDELLGRIVMQKQKRDGYLYDSRTNVRVLGYDASTVRAKLLWNATPDLNFKLTFSYNQDNAPRGDVLLARELGLTLPGVNPRLGLPVAPMLPTNPWDAHLDTQGYTEIKGTSLSLHANWDTAIGEFQSISSYQKSKTDQRVDTDGTSYPILVQTLYEKDETFQQELRLVGGGDRLKYITGVYYLHDNNGPFDAGLVFLPGSAGYAAGLAMQMSSLQTGGNTFAVYGQLDYSITDSLTVTGGLRWARDHIEAPLTLYNVTRAGTIAPGAVINYERETSFNALTGDIALSYTVQPDVMLFARYGRGDRAGGFNGATNILAIADVPFKPQTLDALEAGIKSEFLDRHLRVNASVFYNMYSDMQVTTNIPPPSGVGAINVIVNAATANVPGAEFEVNALLNSHFRLNASYNYLDAKIGKYELQPGQIPASTDITGMRIPRSPKHVVNLGLVFNTDIGDGLLTLTGDMYYSSGFSGDYGFNAVTQTKRCACLPEREVFNISAQYEIGDWSISGFVRNLFNKEYYQTAGIASGAYDIAIPGEPRTFEVTLRRNF